MIDLKPACEGLIRVLGGVGDDQLGASTVCDDYSVGDLIDHVDLVARGSIALTRRDTEAMVAAAITPTAAHLGPDWRDRVDRDLQALGQVWDDPAAWQGSGNVPGSDLSNETWAKIALTEVVVHGWDLARATGQPFALPEATLQACFEHVAEFVPNAPVPDIWGDPVEVAADAPLLDRIVAITGRTP
jgi:uncharacterized protein (TIGR03086 family)